MNKAFSHTLIGLVMGIYGILGLIHIEPIKFILYAASVSFAIIIAWLFIYKRSKVPQYNPDFWTFLVIFFLSLSLVRGLNNYNVAFTYTSETVISKARGGGRYKKYSIWVEPLNKKISVYESQWLNLSVGDSITIERSVGMLGLKSYRAM